MIDADGGGTLSKAEIVDAVKNNDEVIKFLSNCGNENLQSLLVPSRLEHALNCLDTDSDGEITAPEWEAAIEQALRAKIEQRRAAREAQAAADRRELEAFKEQFLNAAREVFALIDADDNGSLTKTEIVDAVARQEGHQLPRQLRRAEPAVPAAAEAPREGIEGAGHVAGRRDRRRRVGGRDL